MRKWNTQFDRRRVRTAVGDRIRKKYGPVFDDNGSLMLEEIGTEDLYGYIQSFADSCDIHVLLKRYQNGETDVLSRVQGVYADFSNMPKDYAGFLNTLQHGKDIFSEMPAQIRAKFGHDFNVFMQALCDGSFAKIAGVEESKVVPDVPAVEAPDQTEVK